MALTSTDVNNQSFSIDRKGYDVDEVDVFLERVAAELDDLNNQVESLKAKLRRSREETSSDGVSRLELDKRDQRIRELEASLAERRADDSAIAQALIIAQRSADEIITNANNNAEVTRQDAEDEAQRIVDKANAEKQRILDDIKKLEDDREDARGRYIDLLNDFISSSQDILVDLEGKKLLSSKSRANHGAYAPRSVSSSAAVATYTTPTMNQSVAAPSAPRPSQVEKDFSGFGDTEDSFELDDLD